MALWISPELSTARRSNPPAALTARTLGSMTQDLSAGTSSPQPVPGTPAAPRQPGRPRSRLPRPGHPTSRRPRPRRPPRPRPPPRHARLASQGQECVRHEALDTEGAGPEGQVPAQAARAAAGRAPCAIATGRDAGVAPDAGTAAERRIRIGSPASLLAVVPVLLGFEPGNSMVVIGVGQPGAEVRLTLRYDLPDPGLAPAVAAHAMSVLTAQRIQTAVAVGYGPEHLVSPVAAALRDCAPGGRRYRDRAAPGGKPALLVLRVRETRPAARQRASRSTSGTIRLPGPWPPRAPACWPAGTRWRLRSRRSTGAAAEQMRQATREAEEQVARAIARAARSGRKASVRRLIATVGLPAVSEGIRRYRGGEAPRTGGSGLAHGRAA